jgi:hypothetical protein
MKAHSRSTLAILLLAAAAVSACASSQIEILKVTVGEPTLLSPNVYQNRASVDASSTGTVAAFYPGADEKQSMRYRVSTDAGHTFGPELTPPDLRGGTESVPLPDGRVLKLRSDTIPIEGEENWYSVPTYLFSEDFSQWETFDARLFVPSNTVADSIKVPIPAKGKIIQLENGDLLMPMYSRFAGDPAHRAYVARSTDGGQTWNYLATIAYSPTDPNPLMIGHTNGYTEPSIVQLADGRLLAVVREQYSHVPGDFRPLVVSWSDDQGKTWSPPQSTQPHLMNISPTLAVLDNGVVACQYGRPGFHVAFSIDGGKTWRNRISFSHLPEPVITGQCDLVRVGPNQLVAVGSDAAGTRAWPITVDRIKVSPATQPLVGRILDDQGQPIARATVEHTPNRYAANDWLEGTRMDPWNVAPIVEGEPQLSFLSIDPANNNPITTTDDQGYFRFDDTALGEYVLTVQADRYAPQHRHVELTPDPQSHDFALNPGTFVRGQVVDADNQPLPGICVILNAWHTHTDDHGFFHWSITAPLPDQVTVHAEKRYSKAYQPLNTTATIKQLQTQPLVLH